MMPPGAPILSAAAMRAAEAAMFVQGVDPYALMERAGAGIADWIVRLAAGRDVLVLCGPGNNGGDGYVAARIARDRGCAVRVAALAAPATDNACRAADAWAAPVDDVMTAAPAPVLVDALFGIGIARPLDPVLAARLAMLAGHSWLSIAVDLPSGVATDHGSAPTPGLPAFDVTLALGALKPAHVLEPAASLCGRVRLIDIGLALADCDDRVLVGPKLCPPTATDHKYSRGMVVIVQGAMPGAAALAARAALGAGAGYVLMLGDTPPPGLPQAVVWRPWSADALAQSVASRRHAAVLIGPGLGREDAARARLDAALALDAPLVIDGDALHLITLDQLTARPHGDILTPHGGEFAALFGGHGGSKIDATRAAAQRVGATIVHKGADTVIARHDGSVTGSPHGNPWLSTAGTGDVLAGCIAALCAGRAEDPAAAGVWLHAMAARRLGGPFIADDLAIAVDAARAGR